MAFKDREGFSICVLRLLLQNLQWGSIIGNCKKTFIKRKNLIVTKKQKKRMEEEDRFLSQFQHFGLLWWDKTIQKIFCKKKSSMASTVWRRCLISIAKQQWGQRIGAVFNLKSKIFIFIHTAICLLLELMGSM